MALLLLPLVAVVLPLFKLMPLIYRWRMRSKIYRWYSKLRAFDPERHKEEGTERLLDKIKSQGVRELDDSAMIMRLKFKTIPGEQFVIRREVFRMIQESFRENGIEFAHRNVTVYMPPGEEAGEHDKKVEERLIVDRKFQNELLDGGASEFAAKTMYNAVRVGGKEELCLPFSWSFARVASCKPGVGLILKQ
ncbi:MAG: hypothetical protein KJP23_17810 [Deltaproteobacteria bacterium]|nr:hypothetical protein [Deltaproteobacteria bacterium]